MDTEQTTLQYELGFVMSESDLTVYLVLTLIGDPPVAIVFTTNRRVTAEISDMSGKVVWTETMLEKGPGEDLLKDGESLPYGVSVTPLPKDLKPGIYVVECTLHDAVLKPVVRTVVRIKDNSTIKLSSKNH